MDKHFRYCAGAIVFNSDGDVFLGNRNDTAGDSWQFPQGGIEKGETPEDAARRELFEETGISSVKLVYTTPQFRRYEFPDDIKKKFRERKIFNDGQDISFSLFYFTGNEDEICLSRHSPEFRDYRWASLDFAASHIIFFKKNVYHSVVQEVAPVIADYLTSRS